MKSSKGRLQRKRLSFQQLECRHLLAGEIQPDIDPGQPEVAEYWEPDNLVQVQRGAIFTAKSALYGNELWFTNGQETRLVKDLVGETTNPRFQYFVSEPSIVTAKRVAFTVVSDTFARLYITDGTEAGTKQVDELALTESQSRFQNFFGTYLFFNDKLFYQKGGVYYQNRGDSNGSTPIPSLSTADKPLIQFKTMDRGQSLLAVYRDEIVLYTKQFDQASKTTFAFPDANIRSVYGDHKLGVIETNEFENDPSTYQYKLSQGLAALDVRGKTITPFFNSRQTNGQRATNIVVADNQAWFVIGGRQLWRSVGNPEFTANVADFPQDVVNIEHHDLEVVSLGFQWLVMVGSLNSDLFILSEDSDQLVPVNLNVGTWKLPNIMLNHNIENLKGLFKSQDGSVYVLASAKPNENNPAPDKTQYVYRFKPGEQSPIRVPNVTYADQLWPSMPVSLLSLGQADAFRTLFTSEIGVSRHVDLATFDPSTQVVTDVPARVDENGRRLEGWPSTIDTASRYTYLAENSSYRFFTRATTSSISLPYQLFAENKLTKVVNKLLKPDGSDGFYSLQLAAVIDDVLQFSESYPHSGRSGSSLLSWQVGNDVKSVRLLSDQNQYEKEIGYASLVMNDVVYFLGIPSDASSNGLYLLAKDKDGQIRKVTEAPLRNHPFEFLRYEDKIVLLTSWSTSEPNRLFVTDGTTDGTKEIPLPQDQDSVVYRDLQLDRTGVYFASTKADGSYNVQSIWKLDVETLSVAKYTDVSPVSPSGQYERYFTIDGAHFLIRSSGLKLLRYDELSGKFLPIIDSAAKDIQSLELTVSQSEIAYITTSDSRNKKSLWALDKTGSMTRVLVDTAASDFVPVNFNGQKGMVFQGVNDQSGHQLYYSDGTAAQTFSVSGLFPNGAFAKPAIVNEKSIVWMNIDQSGAMKRSELDLSALPLRTDYTKLFLDENTPNEQSVGFINIPESLRDTAVRFELVNDSVGSTALWPFSVDSLTGEIQVSNSSQLNFESDRYFSRRVRVVPGPESGLDALEVSLDIFLVNRNEAPYLIDASVAAVPPSFQVQILEGMYVSPLTSSSLGPVLVAFDPDGDVARIQSESLAIFDFEDTPTRFIQVSVGDAYNGSLRTNYDVTFNVLDVKEALEPYLNTIAEYSVDAATIQSIDLGELNFYDPDAHPEIGPVRPNNLRLETVDGSALPDWLSFDGQTRLLNVEAWNGDAGLHSFELIAVDEDGLETIVPVRLDIAYRNAPWQNPTLPGDADGNGQVEPRDALLIINRIARQSGRNVDPLTRLRTHFFDVNGDNLVTPFDALKVINHIARQRSSIALSASPEGYPLVMNEQQKSDLTDAAISLLF